jgi:hypothetical protein
LEQGAATFAGALIGQVPISAWILVAAALFALGILLYAALRGGTGLVDLEKATQAVRALDIQAFRNLVDPAEEAFLRDNLPPKQFRAIKRQRNWAALIYLWEAGSAATALAGFGQAAQRSSDPEMAAAGLQLAENAFRLRLQTIAASVRVLTGIAFPTLHGRALPPSLDQYDRAADIVFRLGRFSSGAGLARSKSA